MSTMNHRIRLAFWLTWVAAIAAATAATLVARVVAILIDASPPGRALSGLRFGLARSVQLRSVLIAGSTFAVFLVAALWGAAWVIGLVSGPASLIRLGPP
jgi:hypothetical protein